MSQIIKVDSNIFVNSDILNAEIKSIFWTSWILLPLSNESIQYLQLNGARSNITLSDIPLFLQRDWYSSKLSCFLNICTHALYPLVQGPEREKTIICKQHGRQFDHNGYGLRHKNLDTENIERLVEFPVIETKGFVYVCLDRTILLNVSHSWFANVLFTSIIPPTILSFLKPEKYVPSVAWIKQEVQGNWKQHIMNYLDDSHISYVHMAPGGLADIIDMKSSMTTVHNEYVQQIGYCKSPDQGFGSDIIPFNATGQRVFALWFFIWPNLAVSIYSWGISLRLYMPDIQDPLKTYIYLYRLVWDESKFTGYDEFLAERIGIEDYSAIARVADALKSPILPDFEIYPEIEKGIAWFYKKYLNINK